LPSGSLRLCSIPALKPSIETLKPATRTFDICALSSPILVLTFAPDRSYVHRAVFFRRCSLSFIISSKSSDR
jgi:hypothetical protein